MPYKEESERFERLIGEAYRELEQEQGEEFGRLLHAAGFDEEGLAEYANGNREAIFNNALEHIGRYDERW